MVDKKKTVSIHHRPATVFPLPGESPTSQSEGGLSDQLTQQVRGREETRKLKHELSELKAQNEALLRGSSNVVTLTLREGRKVAFERVRVAPEDIESKTFVNHLNGRDQRFLTQESVSDITQDLLVGGQLYPAIGVHMEGGRILILAGSRRRLACIIAKHTYDILVSSEMLSPADVEFISSASNSHKPLSIVDMGLKWSTELKDECHGDRSLLASRYGVTTMTVSRVLKAAAIPTVWIEMFPDVNSLTHPIISKLANASTGLNAEQIDLVVAQVKPKLDGDEYRSSELDAKTEIIVSQIVSASESLPSKSQDTTKSKGGRTPPVKLLSNGSKVISLQSMASKSGTHSIRLNGTDLTDAERALLVEGIDALVAKIRDMSTKP
ncbi:MULTISPECIES: ParB N-terminal domain-containing protein [Aeromonas]|uniref:ParB N-terminal domain-containing protein n=1 Tax=Aeromonas caviae TaxID=648 RepID=A0AAJ6CS66_AERCA|nr:ParB N-terminal domain-containing protein [Aeromonas caviae]WFG00238.1 ParB N-terminal domain-containing protein [Aeromonas caviae]WVM47834.1 ParB N-terminal domain-containing protein [Aeromonas hydrophila]